MLPTAKMKGAWDYCAHDGEASHCVSQHTSGHARNGVSTVAVTCFWDWTCWERQVERRHVQTMGQAMF